MTNQPLYINVGRSTCICNGDSPPLPECAGEGAPPPEWAKLAEPCETCGRWQPDDLAVALCETCHNQRTIHTITVPCGHHRIHPNEPDCDCQCGSCVAVTDCNEFGTVSVRVTVKLVQAQHRDGPFSPVLGPPVSPGDWVVVMAIDERHPKERAL